MTTLNETLTLIAAQIKADAKALIAFAAEDTLGGYHWNEQLRTFPSGSLWQVEGQILYALVRWLKPERVVEIGGWAGASASHLAAAVQANGVGEVISVDSGVGGQDHGHLLTPALRKSVTLVNEDGVAWLLAQAPESIGLLFEDADHSTELVRRIMEAALSRMESGGIIANHDAAHDFAYLGGGVKVNSSVGREVRDGLARANVYFRPYLAEPSDCGLAITLMPGVRNLDKPSAKPPTVETPKPMSVDDLKAALQGLSPQQVNELLSNVRPEPIPAQAKADARPLAEVKPQFGTDNEVPYQFGNAHIESAPEPRPIVGKVVHENDGSGVTEFEIGEKPKRNRPSRAKAK